MVKRIVIVAAIVFGLSACSMAQIKGKWDKPWVPERSQSQRTNDQHEQKIIGEVGAPTPRHAENTENAEVANDPNAAAVIANASVRLDRQNKDASSGVRHDSLLGSAASDADSQKQKSSTNWLMVIVIGAIVLAGAFFGVPMLITKMAGGPPPTANL